MAPRQRQRLPATTIGLLFLGKSVFLGSVILKSYLPAGSGELVMMREYVVSNATGNVLHTVHAGALKLPLPQLTPSWSLVELEGRTEISKRAGLSSGF